MSCFQTNLRGVLVQEDMQRWGGGDVAVGCRLHPVLSLLANSALPASQALPSLWSRSGGDKVLETDCHLGRTAPPSFVLPAGAGGDVKVLLSSDQDLASPAVSALVVE